MYPVSCILYPVSCILYLGGFLLPRRHPEVEAVEGGAVQLAGQGDRLLGKEESGGMETGRGGGDWDKWMASGCWGHLGFEEDEGESILECEALDFPRILGKDGVKNPGCSDGVKIRCRCRLACFETLNCQNKKCSPCRHSF